MLKIAVIDDHELVLDGICAQLAKEEKFDIIGAFTEVEELKLCLKCKKSGYFNYGFDVKRYSWF